MAKHIDKIGRNLLHIAAMMYHRRSLSIPDLTELIELLVENGVDPCQKDYGGYLPIDHTNRCSDLHNILARMMERKKQMEKKVEAERLKEAAAKSQPSKTIKSKPRDKCGKCQDDYYEAFEYQDTDSEQMFKLCVRIMKEKKHAPGEHNRWVTNCRNLIMKTMISERGNLAYNGLA
jgi:hypothetical protein